MKTIERLRQMKGKALDDMTELNNRARAEGRDLKEAEDIEYRLKRTWAEDLNALIGLAETELLHFQESAPEPLSAAPESDDPGPNLAERVLAWKI